jgi:uncharacterized membrane protein
MPAELEKETEEIHKSPRENRELSVSDDFFCTSIIALLVALVALLFTYTFSLYLIFFVEDYPYNNKNIAKYVATGFADQTLATVGVILGAIFVVFAIFAVLSYLDIRKGEEQSKKLLKIYLVVTILSGLSAAAVGSMWWPAKYTQAQAYNNSPAASCLKVNNDADYVDGQCVVTYNINVVDSMFAYSEKKEAVKEIDGKYVKGTEYTVTESGKNYGNTYKPNDKVFLSDDEFVNREQRLQVGDSAYIDYAENRHLNSDSSYSSGNALGDDKKYVIHFTDKEHKTNIPGDITPPKIRSIGTKISVEGNDYTYINTKPTSKSLSESDMLVVRSDELNK